MTQAVNAPAENDNNDNYEHVWPLSLILNRNYAENFACCKLCVHTLCKDIIILFISYK